MLMIKMFKANLTGKSVPTLPGREAEKIRVSIKVLGERRPGCLKGTPVNSIIRKNERQDAHPLRIARLT